MPPSQNHHGPTDQPHDVPALGPVSVPPAASEGGRVTRVWEAPPPTQVAPVPRPEPSSWPTVLGVIAIIFGALGVFGGCLTVASPFVARWMERNFIGPSDVNILGLPTSTDMVALVVGLGVLEATLGVWLLVGGIGLARRRRASAWPLKTWAVAKVFYVVISTVVMAVLQQPQMEAMAQDPSMAPLGSGFVEMMTYVGVVIQILWGSALPVFLLIWLSRRPIREEMSAWA